MEARIRKGFNRIEGTLRVQVSIMYAGKDATKVKLELILFLR